MTFYDYCKENNKETFLTFWSNKNEFSPKDITPSSRKKAIFECPVCGWQTEKVIHDIRNNRGIVCKECEAKKKTLQQETKQKEKLKRKTSKKEMIKSIIKDYITIQDIPKYKGIECHFVAKITNKKIYRKKDKSVSKIKYFCSDSISGFDIDFLIQAEDIRFDEYSMNTLIEVKAVKDKDYFSYKLQVIEINEISKEQYDEIQQIFTNRENKRKENREKSKIKRELDKELKKKKQQEIEMLPFEKRYLMLDVETNGVNATTDDLLEIAIYKPDENKFFHKYLPLTKQNSVLTTQFNGITKEMLESATHLNEEDVKILFEEFEIDKRIILHYGTLDAPFIKKYFQEHHIPRRTTLKFYNFKNLIHSSKWSHGNITKDNLCRAIGLENIQDVHSAKNDCLLQWELFKKIDNKPWFITSTLVNVYDIYKYNPDYYMPASYIQSYGRIHQLTGCKLPTMQLEKIRDVVSIDLPKELNKYSPWLIDYFLGNIMEQQINVGLDAKDLSMESFIWCAKNKSCLEKVGSFSVKSDTPIIEYAFKKDGKIETLGDKEKKENVLFLSRIVRKIKYEIERYGYTCEITPKGIYRIFEDEKELVFDLSIFPDITIGTEIEDDEEWIVVYGNNNLLMEKITNEFIEIVQPYTKEFANKIKSIIFRNKEIYSQENVISDKYHTLALCDFSNEYAIMEMKVSCSPWLTSNYASQCFLQAIGVPATNNFTPILKDFKDIDLPIEKRREMHLCIYDNKQNKLMVSEYRFCKKV